MDIKLILLTLIKVYELLLFVRIICSWIPGVERQDWFKPLYAVTEPVLAPFRKIIPPIGGVLDLSPMVVFFIFELLSMFVAGGKRI